MNVPHGDPGMRASALNLKSVTDTAGLKGRMEWELRPVDGSAPPTSSHPLGQRLMRVGRHSEANISLQDTEVSRWHAEIVVRPDSVLVRDLGSTNGTFVNGARVQGLTSVADGQTIQFGKLAFLLVKLNHRANAEREAKTKAWSDVQKEVERLVEEPAVEPYFQPVVLLSTREVIGYEVLARSPIDGLEVPEKMFKVASSIGREADLSTVVRSEGVRHSQRLPDGLGLYLNLHPSEVPHLPTLKSLAKLRHRCPNRPITVEIPEACVDVADHLRLWAPALEELNIELAFDDFGPAQSRMAALAVAAPNAVKFGIPWIRNLDSCGQSRRKLVQSLVEFVRDMNIRPFAKGIEREAEAEACLSLGFEGAQGFLFGSPMPAENLPIQPQAAV
jgi:EAL domain-containing protein (putative c-di-GMP-specific phosphodiesterase class I)